MNPKVSTTKHITRHWTESMLVVSWALNALISLPIALASSSVASDSRADGTSLLATLVFTTNIGMLAPLKFSPFLDSAAYKRKKILLFLSCGAYPHVKSCPQRLQPSWKTLLSTGDTKHPPNGWNKVVTKSNKVDTKLQGLPIALASSSVASDSRAAGTPLLATLVFTTNIGMFAFECVLSFSTSQDAYAATALSAAYKRMTRRLFLSSSLPPL
ncbi:hypothetical protein EYF80_011994 [Liparis tanakae]|uniref:Uncharacterized protein n=1 Tax=Liparis tanakae TaxID=230148 RepID=A0A4Z2IIE0_9TELE|nr:hypothetical protein EYF80_011994 [Liparis tanakae]